ASATPPRNRQNHNTSQSLSKTITHKTHRPAPRRLPSSYYRIHSSAEKHTYSQRPPHRDIINFLFAARDHKPHSGKDSGHVHSRFRNDGRRKASARRGKVFR